MNKFFHSVYLAEMNCTGCYNCIKRCPTNAIRVRDGKARVISEYCIDCGECVRSCKQHAKSSKRNKIKQDLIGKYDYIVALPSQVLYSQFNNLDDINIVLTALKLMGFDDIVEVASAEELFDYPLHPYTHSLISAIPIPDPQLEKNKVLFTYDPSVHDYSEDKPELTCIGHDHYVFGNKKEIEEYKAIREKNVPLKSVTIRQPGEEETEQIIEETSDEPILDTPVHDTGSFWYKFLSFLLPVLGFIAGGIFKRKRYYRNYKACKKGAIAGLVTIGVILALFGLLLVLAVV